MHKNINKFISKIDKKYKYISKSEKDSQIKISESHLVLQGPTGYLLAVDE